VLIEISISSEVLIEKPKNLDRFLIEVYQALSDFFQHFYQTSITSEVLIEVHRTSDRNFYQFYGFDRGRAKL
jgi:hypothetical protein